MTLFDSYDYLWMGIYLLGLLGLTLYLYKKASAGNCPAEVKRSAAANAARLRLACSVCTVCFSVCSAKRYLARYEYIVTQLLIFDKCLFFGLQRQKNLIKWAMQIPSERGLL